MTGREQLPSLNESCRKEARNGMCQARFMVSKPEYDHRKHVANEIIKKFLESGQSNMTLDAMSREQRKVIHKVAQCNDIITTSKGQEPQRFIILSKQEKKLSAPQIVRTEPIRPSFNSMLNIKNLLKKSSITNEEMNEFLTEKPAMFHSDKNISLNFQKAVPPKPKCSKQMKKIKNKLPVSKYKESILKHISTCDVVIISGGTGSGKTTQVPQFILEEAHEKQKKVRIVVTQPRRIAAISISERVAKERGETLGDTVGYHVKLESRRSKHTLLTYCTTGVLLRMLTSNEEASGITHIILDEIHEREINTDYLLITLRECLKKRKDLKIILMSATIEGNMQLFVKYFENQKVGVIRVESRSYDVKIFYLDAILALSGYKPPEKDILFSAFNFDPNDWEDELKKLGVEDERRNPENVLSNQNNTYITPERKRLAALLEIEFRKELETVFPVKDDYFHPRMNNLVDSIDITKFRLAEKYNLFYGFNYKCSIDYSLLNHVIHYLSDSPIFGTILVFLPGYDDIQEMMKMIKEWGDKLTNMKHVLVLPLHSQIHSANHKDIFKAVPEDTRKIILATNIAEASITIEDVIFVVDTGKVKEYSYDHEAKLSTLTVKPIARSNADQRSGRAGRVAHGYCFRLYPEEEYISMSETQVAEMKRAAIYDVTLRAKLFAPNTMKIAEFLSLAPEPPEVASIIQSMTFLEQIGAFYTPDKVYQNDDTVEVENCDQLEIDDPHLTDLGHLMSKLPLDPQLCRMVLFGLAIKCLTPIINLVALLSNNEPYLLPGTVLQRTIQTNKKHEMAKQDFSDHLMYIRLCSAFCSKTTYYQQYQFCNEHYLNFSTMKMIQGTRRQLIQELSRAGLIKIGDKDVMTVLCDRNYNQYSNNLAMIRAAIAAGCYPSVGVCSATCNLKRVKTCNDKAANLHPSSILHTQVQSAKWDCNPLLEYVVFQEMYRKPINGSLLMKIVTVIPSVTALLFTGPVRLNKQVFDEYGINFEKEEDAFFDANPSPFEWDLGVFNIDKWYSVTAEKSVLCNLLRLRHKFMHFFIEGITKSEIFGKDTSPFHMEMLDAIKNLMESEHRRHNYSQANNLHVTFRNSSNYQSYNHQNRPNIYPNARNKNQSRGQTNKIQELEKTSKLRKPAV